MEEAIREFVDKNEPDSLTLWVHNKLQKDCDWNSGDLHKSVRSLQIKSTMFKFSLVVSKRAIPVHFSSSVDISNLDISIQNHNFSYIAEIPTH